MAYGIGCWARLALVVALLGPGAAMAADEDDPIDTCLKAWGEHPFGTAPRYRTLATTVKVFGIGENVADTRATDAPALVLVNPGVNVMGGAQIELLNPNGWYCLRATVNVMGGLTIRAHCRAHIATATGSVAVAANNPGQGGVVVMGSTEIVRVGCDASEPAPAPEGREPSPAPAPATNRI